MGTKLDNAMQELREHQARERVKREALRNAAVWYHGRHAACAYIAAEFRRDAGGTFMIVPHASGPDNYTLAKPKDGFVIGGAGVSWVQRAPFTADQIRAFAFTSTGPRLPGVGAWLDSQTGKWWLDSVSWTPLRVTADRFARDRGELAYWDCERGEEVRVTR